MSLPRAGVYPDRLNRQDVLAATGLAGQSQAAGARTGHSPGSAG